jgi:hypothetical protein
MKLPYALLVGLVLPSLAVAQTQIDGRSLPCGQLAAAVQARGSVVISTAPYTYDRYVTGGQHCVRPEIPVPTWIRTVDSPQCFIGYVCRDRPTFTGR